MWKLLVISVVINIYSNSVQATGPLCDNEEALYILWPDTQNDEMYYQCYDIGKFIHLKCGDNKIFNSDYQKCLSVDESTIAPTTMPPPTTINRVPSTPRSTAPTASPKINTTLPLMPTTPDDLDIKTGTYED